MTSKCLHETGWPVNSRFRTGMTVRASQAIATSKGWRTERQAIIIPYALNCVQIWESAVFAKRGACVNTTLRFLVADDHEVLRRGLKEILEARPGWTVVGEALTGREAVVKAVSLKPEVVILDISMPELNGVETTRRIRAAVPECQILILTQHDSPQLAEAALAAGAHGYLLKSDAARDLVTAVESLRQGRPFLTATVAQMVLEGYRQTLVQRSPADTLTSREREVLQLLAEGKTNPQVAAALDISVKTAETHRARVMRKLQLRSIPDLVSYAVRNGLVQP